MSGVQQHRFAQEIVFLRGDHGFEFLATGFTGFMPVLPKL